MPEAQAKLAAEVGGEGSLTVAVVSPFVKPPRDHVSNLELTWDMAVSYLSEHLETKALVIERLTSMSQDFAERIVGGNTRIKIATPVFTNARINGGKFDLVKNPIRYTVKLLEFLSKEIR